MEKMNVQMNVLSRIEHALVKTIGLEHTQEVMEDWDEYNPETSITLAGIIRFMTSVDAYYGQVTSPYVATDKEMEIFTAHYHNK